MSLRLKNRKVLKVFLLTSGEYKITFSDKNTAVITETRLASNISSWEFELIYLKEKSFLKLNETTINSLKGISDKAKDRLVKIGLVPTTIINEIAITKSPTIVPIPTASLFSNQESPNSFLNKMSSIIKKIRL